MMIHGSDYYFGDLSPSKQRLLVSNAVFWSLSVAFLIVDLIARNHPESSMGRRLRSYKLQPQHILSNREYAEIALVAAFNMFILSSMLCWIDENYLQGHHLSSPLSESDSWIPLRELGCFMGSIIVLDIWFFSFHLLLHKSPWLYQTVHKMHHKWTAPCAMAAVYAHPVEFIISNVLGIEVGLKITNAHPFTSYGFYAYVLMSTCWDHSGYRWFLLGENIHDSHHEFFQYNYGIGLMDYLCGTSREPSTLIIKRKKME